MLTFLISALDWMLLGWMFWLVLFLLVITPHSVLSGVYRNGDFEAWLMVPVALLAGAVYWRWSAFLPHSWLGWALLAGVYLVVGFTYSLGKYIGALKDLKTRALRLTAEQRRDDDAIRQALGYNNNASVRDGKITLDWKTIPLANWWIYWPWFACSSLFNFITDFGRHLVNLFKDLYSRLAERFAVKL